MPAGQLAGTGDLPEHQHGPLGVVDRAGHGDPVGVVMRVLLRGDPGGGGLGLGDAAGEPDAAVGGAGDDQARAAAASAASSRSSRVGVADDVLRHGAPASAGPGCSTGSALECRACGTGPSRTAATICVVGHGQPAAVAGPAHHALDQHHVVADQVRPLLVSQVQPTMNSPSTGGTRKPGAAAAGRAGRGGGRPGWRWRRRRRGSRAAACAAAGGASSRAGLAVTYAGVASTTWRGGQVPPSVAPA